MNNLEFVLSVKIKQIDSENFTFMLCKGKEIYKSFIFKQHELEFAFQILLTEGIVMNFQERVEQMARMA